MLEGRGNLDVRHESDVLFIRHARTVAIHAPDEFSCTPSRQPNMLCHEYGDKAPDLGSLSRKG